MMVQFFDKVAVISMFYSIIILLLCGISSGKIARVAGVQRLASWLRAVLGLVGSYLILAVTKMLLPTAVLFNLPLFFGLPTLCALFYWSHESKVSRIAMSMTCMVLFIAHPIGFYAAPYTLFWFIPVIIALLPQSGLLTAFGSTFTAHAVGSVMHLYLLNTLAADAWIALMPIVIIERCILALSAWIGYVLAHKIADFYVEIHSGNLYVCK